MKCEYCNKKKPTKSILCFDNDEQPASEHEICIDCIKIEAPYLDWNKLSDLSGLNNLKKG